MEVKSAWSGRNGAEGSPGTFWRPRENQFVVANIGTKWTLWVDGKETLSLNLKRSDVEKESVNFIGFGPFLLNYIFIEELSH